MVSHVTKMTYELPILYPKMSGLKLLLICVCSIAALSLRKSEIFSKIQTTAAPDGSCPITNATANVLSV